MAKKIAIITGSPRKDGNSSALATAFAAGAIAAGNEVKTFDAASATIDGCHGDCSCHKRGTCGLKDDCTQVYELMNWADVLVLATPVYWGGYPSQLKRVIDRFNCYNAPIGRALCTVKETVLIATACMDDVSAFASMEADFALMNQILQFDCAGKLLAPGLNGPDEAGQDVALLTKATVLGFSI